MGKYLVRLNGCDDTTRARVELTDAQAEFTKKLFAAVSSASAYGCQPKASILDAPDPDEPDEFDDTEEVQL